MKMLIQRVSHANVTVENTVIGAIEKGLLVFVGFDKDDCDKDLVNLANKLQNYRVFADQNGKMNLNVGQAQGGILIVSQFTLSADTRKGLRPSFSQAAPPSEAQEKYNRFVALMRQSDLTIQTGQFGADMQVHLLNDGPVTFLLES